MDESCITANYNVDFCPLKDKLFKNKSILKLSFQRIWMLRNGQCVFKSVIWILFLYFLLKKKNTFYTLLEKYPLFKNREKAEYVLIQED